MAAEGASAFTSDFLIQIPAAALVAAPLGAEPVAVDDWETFFLCADLVGQGDRLLTTLLQFVNRRCDLRFAFELAIDGVSMTSFDSTCGCYFSEWLTGPNALFDSPADRQYSIIIGSSENFTFRRARDRVAMQYGIGPGVEVCSIEVLRQRVRTLSLTMVQLRSALAVAIDARRVAASADLTTRLDLIDTEVQRCLVTDESHP